MYFGTAYYLYKDLDPLPYLLPLTSDLCLYSFGTTAAFQSPVSHQILAAVGAHGGKEEKGPRAVCCGAPCLGGDQHDTRGVGRCA